MLGHPESARRGNFLSALGMLIAIVVTLLSEGILTWYWIAICAVIGSIIGASAARLVAMTSMPEMVAVFNGFGGAASLLVAWAALFDGHGLFVAITVTLSVIIGGVTFAGSVVAWGKLSEVMTSRAIVFNGQRIVNSLLLLAHCLRAL